MPRPNFTVVTGVVAALVFLGAVTKLLMPLVPPPAPNDLAGSRDDYLLQGSREPVAWHPYGDAAFAQALHDEKPILMVVGTPWSSLARRMDGKVFTDPDVARYLNRNFVCIRVDASADRKWLAAYLPYSRLALGVLPGFQTWVLDAHGQMLDLIGRVSSEQNLDADMFLAALIDARNLVDKIARDQTTPIVPDQAQRADLTLLEQSPRSILPRFEQYALDLTERIPPRFGGFPKNGLQPLQPNAWRYLVVSGHPVIARQAIDPVLFSTLSDLVDGGFFRLSTNDDTRTIDFDKVATQNAEAAASLAMLEWATHDPVYRYFGIRAFDTVLDTLIDDDGLIATCRTGVSTRDQRSPAHSFGRTALDSTLAPEDASWARDRLGMAPPSNPQMVPYFPSREALHTEPARRDRILALLRRSVTQPDPLAGLGSAEAHGHAVARLMEAARAWGDTVRLSRLAPLADGAECFRKEGRIVSRPDSNLSSDYLGDWLAYADIELQDFLANGRVVSLDHGAMALNRALEMFEGDAPGEYFVTPRSARPLGAQNASAPEVADNIQESCAARVIRLCTDYGDLLSGTPRGVELKRRAYAAADLYSVALQHGGPAVAGYFAACYGLKDDSYALVSGPNAVSDANALFRLAPTKLVAPAIGPVGPKLHRRPPGVYIVRLGMADGPFSIEEAARLLARSRASTKPSSS